MKYCDDCGAKLKRVKRPEGSLVVNGHVVQKYNEKTGKPAYSFSEECRNPECKEGQESLCPYYEHYGYHQKKWGWWNSRCKGCPAYCGSYDW